MQDTFLPMMNFELEQIKDSRQQITLMETKVNELEEETKRLKEIISPGNYLAGIREIEDEIKHNTILRFELRKRLQMLEIEQARKGINAPPEVQKEILDIQDRMNEIDTKLKILKYDLSQFKSPGTGNS